MRELLEGRASEMPIKYRIDASSEIITVTVSGVVGDGDPEQQLAALLDDPHYSRSFAVLTDARQIDGLELTAEGLRNLADYAQALEAQLKGRKLALVASSDAIFGMARMYQMLRTGSEYDVAVFREFEAAMSWVSGIGDKPGLW